MAAIQDVPRLVLQAILASQSPLAPPQQRKDAVAFLEQFKAADVSSVLSVCAVLMSLQQLAAQYGSLLQPTDVVGVRLAAYQLFTDVVRNRWRELGAEQRLAATQLALSQFQDAAAPDPSAAGGSSPLRGKAAELLAVVVRQQGSAAYAELLPQLMAGAAAGPLQAELTCRVLHYISEDLTQFEVSGPGAVGASGDGAAEAATSSGATGAADGPDVTSKRAFLSALTASAPTVFPFLCELLERHFQAAQQLQSAPLPAAAASLPASSSTLGSAAGATTAATAATPAAQRAAEVAAHIAALSAALGALSTWVEWVPMRRLASSPVLGACAFFLREGTPALRLQALDVMLRITWRKRANESPADYAALMDGLGAALLGATAAMGLLLGPQDPLPPAMVRELGHGGSQADLGSRLAEVVCSLGEGHFRCLSDAAGRRAAYLAQLLTLTRHPHLKLSEQCLGTWAQLLREAAPQHALAPGPGGGGAHGGSGSGQGSPTAGGGKAGAQAYSLPTEVCSELMRVMCATMPRVVPSADPGVNDVPDWCDTHSDYKSTVVNYRTHAKAILRSAAALAPEQALQAAAATFSAALASCAAAAPAASAAPAVKAASAAEAPSPTSQLEGAVMVLTAVLQPLCDLAASAMGAAAGSGTAAAAVPSAAAQAAAAALAAGIADLLRAVLAVRLSDPKHMTLHAEALEAFGRFLVVRPDLAVPTVSCCLEVMRLIPLEAPGQLPPPPRQTPEWRAQFEARLAMTTVLLALARAAPGALVPHLSALVSEISGLWERGLLREGERVLLWEGVLAASTAAPTHVQSQLLQLILAPIAAQWGSAEWQAGVASPQAFVQTYMPLVPVQQPAAAPAGPSAAAGPATAAAGSGGSGGGAGGYELGARDRRWTLYHQVTLLERALRRTGPPPASASGPASGPSSSASQPHASSSAPASPTALPEHPFSPHLEWCLPPVARLVGCIHALADPRVRPALGPLDCVNEMDSIERAVRLGEDRDTVKAAEQPEPRCVAGGNVADARYFVRGVRECAYMVLSLATTQAGPAMWRSSALAALLPGAVAGGAAGLGDSVVRLLVRHVLTPWAQRCPPARAGEWMVPLCGAFLPHMHERLTTGWASVQAPPTATATAAPAASGAAAASAAAGSGPGRPGANAATTDEVLRETLLRELSREFLAFLNALANRRPADPATDPAAAAAAALAAGASASQPVVAGAGAAVLSPRVSANGGGLAALQESLLEVLLRTAPTAAQAGLAAGVSALTWPDAETAGRAVTFCRTLLTLAQSGHAELEGVVIGAATRGAIANLGLEALALGQAQSLEFLRSVFAAYLPPRAPQSPLLRAVLGELPGTSPQVLDNFTSAFTSAHGDKEQRALIKQLLAAVGGDQVRKLLAAVSKMPGGITAVPEPRQRERGPASDVTPQDMGLPHLFDLPDVL